MNESHCFEWWQNNRRTTLGMAGVAVLCVGLVFVCVFIGKDIAEQNRLEDEVCR